MSISEGLIISRLTEDLQSENSPARVCCTVGRPIFKSRDNLLRIRHSVEELVYLGNVLLGMHFEQFEEDLFLAGEVRVESAFAVPRTFRNAIDGYALITRAGHQLASRGQQSHARQRAAFLSGQASHAVHLHVPPHSTRSPTIWGTRRLPKSGTVIGRR